MAVCMIGHDRSWAVMNTVVNGQVMDASTIIDHGRAHDRLWAVMGGHARGHELMNGQVMDASTIIDHGRAHDRSWAVMHTGGHGWSCTRS